MKSLMYKWRLGAFYFAVLEKKHPEHRIKKENFEWLARLAHVLTSPRLRRQLEPGVYEDAEAANAQLRQNIKDFRVF